MSRKHGPEPFWRDARQCWYVQAHGKQHKLSSDKDEAWRLWHQIMGRPEEIATADDGTPLVVSIIDEFLTWNEQHRAKRTYEWHKTYLSDFAESLPNPATFTAIQLKPHHVERWLSTPAKKGWGPTYRHGAIRSVQRCFRWAEKQGYIELSPVRHVEKPTPKRREQIVTPKEYARILAAYKRSDPFRDLLEFVWETGCRPQEARIIAARHRKVSKSRIEIPPAEAKGNRWRVIYLNDRAHTIVSRLAGRHKSGPIFRNEDGNPWTAFALNCRFDRLKKKLGVKYALYSFRHGYAQRALEGGMDSITVAALMGHANANMISAVYSHMDKAKDYLAEKVRTMEAASGAA